MVDIHWAERRYLPAGYRWSTGGNPFWRLYWNQSSEMEVQIGDRRIIMAAQTALLLPPSTPIEDRCDAGTDHFFVHFQWPRAQWIGRAEPLDMPAPPAVHRSTLEFDPGSSGLRLCAWVLQALAAFVDAGQASANRELARDTLLEPALQWISESLQDPPTNEMLAARCGLSVAQFVRRFRAAFGNTPHRMVLEMRLRQAAHRLVHTQMPIEQIAREAGFADRVHFTHAFSRHYASPPARFRATIRDESGE
jgi:AraC-like DNA-binding protein